MNEQIARITGSLYDVLSRIVVSYLQITTLDQTIETIYEEDDQWPQLILRPLQHLPKNRPVWIGFSTSVLLQLAENGRQVSLVFFRCNMKKIKCGYVDQTSGDIRLCISADWIRNFLPDRHFQFRKFLCRDSKCDRLYLDHPLYLYNDCGRCYLSCSPARDRCSVCHQPLYASIDISLCTEKQIWSKETHVKHQRLYVCSTCRAHFSLISGLPMFPWTYGAAPMIDGSLLFRGSSSARQ